VALATRHKPPSDIWRGVAGRLSEAEQVRPAEAHRMQRVNWRLLLLVLLAAAVLFLAGLLISKSGYFSTSPGPLRAVTRVAAGSIHNAGYGQIRLIEAAPGNQPVYSV